MAVTVEKTGPVTTVIIERPERRNLETAIFEEFRSGSEVLESEALAGARRSSSGKGRGGSFEDI